MFLQELKEDVRGRMSRTDEDAIENLSHHQSIPLRLLETFLN